MKKIYNLAMLMALLFALHGHAQQIAVVTGGNTSVYQTLQAAIEGASNGSVIYLPGGGFTISDDVKITKRVTIIGIGHKVDSDNVDGATTIGGNQWFNQGSDGSAVMGCYISGNVNIAEDGPVNNVTVKLCNLKSVQVKNAEVTGTFINQNYIRGGSSFKRSGATVCNNIAKSLKGYVHGDIRYNIFVGSLNAGLIFEFENSNVTNNIMLFGCAYYGEGNQTNQNIGYGNNPIVIDVNMSDVFINVPSGYDGTSVSTQYNYHFKDEYKQYESQVGIYAGTGFSDSALPPVPYVVAKKIDEQTDAAGKLKIRLRVNAGE